MFEKLDTWRKERGIDKMEYSHLAEVKKDVEELFELMGYESYQTEFLVKNFINKYYVEKLEPVDTEKADAHCDKIVFAINALESLGFDAEKCMNETIKEISSRKGAFNEESGKWEKFKDQESMNLWVSANYESCRKDK